MVVVVLVVVDDGGCSCASCVPGAEVPYGIWKRKYVKWWRGPTFV
jgi:hypothetical protein